ncbi:MAG TPA: hypothetical protein VLT85_12365 [Terriglobales bacterium]|nr:hypothetical protein [Terriglobales bacterium]
MAMSKRLLTSVVLFVSVFAASGQEPKWKEYEYPEDGFAASFPFLPTVEKMPMETEGGKVEMHDYEVGSDTSWNLGVAVYDVSKFGDLPARELLQAGRNGAVAEVKGQLISERDISLNGTPGIEYEFRNNASHALARSYYVNGRVITMISVAPSAQPLFLGTDRFFSSLRFIPAWSEYAYPEDGCAISAPVKPSRETRLVNTARGQVESHDYNVDLGGDTGVTLSVTDYGKGAKISLEALQTIKGAVLESVKAKLVSEKPIVLDSNPGIEFEMANEGYRARMRYYIVGSRLVTLVSYAGQGKPLPHDSTRILDSMRLLSSKTSDSPQ